MSDLYCDDCGGPLRWGRFDYSEPDLGEVEHTFCPSCRKYADDHTVEKVEVGE